MEARPVQQQSTVCSTEAPLYNLSCCPPKKRFRPAASSAGTVRERFCGIPLLPAKKRVVAFQFGEEQLLTSLLLHQDESDAKNNTMKPVPEVEQNNSNKREEVFETDAPDPDPRTVTAQQENDLSWSCRFCQASGDSEEAGPLMEYRNRSLIPATSCHQGEACHDRPTAVHVHLRCAEWAPNVYYIGDGDGGEEGGDQQIRNVKSEIGRASKLKCHACGSRGAALGCYLSKCRKSFHYGCARRAQTKGRWETERYLFLCDDHAAWSFPGETEGK
ncbi:BRCA1-associated RING domain protein 1-like [Selaginella moellendorffii]|uniref:BRCA1-associated RING domain protein 1-like n=1 Tax=Selaginella moellendorffii TaxID=88036 RepID=UPI000D1CB023|nr:BRCA1-associated RING domain protein 1-like [Selaginella moellendorffii]|eukprot:XP_024539760.1 BRCA1-associated RING domain protein 1-like [Selaginella moellendorffii]